MEKLAKKVIGVRIAALAKEQAAMESKKNEIKEALTTIEQGEQEQINNSSDLDQRKEIEKLDQMEKQEKEYQHRLTSLQESSVLANNNLKVEFTNLLNEKGEYIQQLEKEIRELKTKSKMKTQTEPTTFNYKK
ncbi:46065_t:CDS:2 [Gigaspora margarita]|uniref:46065_t:CDS:1 n=1 Tax=Gigaspora margarita TaxID=4874 RepID=A0ABM8VWW8_GIGMA|nr:46065_t:CDS:2 [Gigaspora margarita]